MSLPTAIKFLALLGYPESAERRSNAEEVMRAYWLRACKDAGTLKTLGRILPVQQMEKGLSRLKARLDKRMAAADDCVNLDMGLALVTQPLPLACRVRRVDRLLEQRRTLDEALSILAIDEGATPARLKDVARKRPTRKYKQDWWRPQVMHLGIALRSVRVRWSEMTALHWTDWKAPFSVETLLLIWPDWIDDVMRVAPLIAGHLARHTNPALRGFRRTKFCMPDGSTLEFR